MMGEFLLGDGNGGIEFVVGQGGIENFMASRFQLGWLYTAWNRLQEN